MEQPYFSRILDSASKDMDIAFKRDGHAHLGYYADANTTDASALAFTAAAGVLAERIFAAAKIGDGMRVLDVGCGLGGIVGKLMVVTVTTYSDDNGNNTMDSSEARTTMTTKVAKLVSYVTKASS